MKLPPCKGCERRTVHPNCHATCEAYKQFVAEQSSANDNRRRYNQYWDYVKHRNQNKKR